MPGTAADILTAGCHGVGRDHVVIGIVDIAGAGDLAGYHGD